MIFTFSQNCGTAHPHSNPLRFSNACVHAHCCHHSNHYHAHDDDHASVLDDYDDCINDRDHDGGCDVGVHINVHDRDDDDYKPHDASALAKKESNLPHQNRLLLVISRQLQTLRSLC